MVENKYERLDRLRADIKRDRAKMAKLQEQIKQKEARLREAEASQIVADVGAMNMSPEQLGEFLSLIQSGKLSELLSGQSAAEPNSTGTYETTSNTDVLADETEEMEDEEY